MNMKTYSLIWHTHTHTHTASGSRYSVYNSDIFSWVMEGCGGRRRGGNNRGAPYSSSVCLPMEEMLVITAIYRERKGLCEYAQSAFINIYSVLFNLRRITERSLRVCTVQAARVSRWTKKQLIDTTLVCTVCESCRRREQKPSVTSGRDLNPRSNCDSLLWGPYRNSPGSVSNNCNVVWHQQSTTSSHQWFKSQFSSC